MENKNVVIVKHHPRPLTLANPFYTTQCPDLEDRIVINLTSRNPILCRTCYRSGRCHF